jgi:hypothetical protein
VPEYRFTHQPPCHGFERHSKINQFGPLAFYYACLYSQKGDAWNGVLASRFFRQASLPAKALEVTELVVEGHIEPKCCAAAWTTRGGAYADLVQIDKAEQCAKTALRIGSTETFHPHNLLGRIYLMKCDVVASARHFERARDLGASDESIEIAIRREMRFFGPLTQDLIKQCLLQLDADQYTWVLRRMKEA